MTETNEFSPYLKIDKNIFKKSGDYEIIIQPSSLSRYNMPPKEMEKYTVRYTLAITLDQENYSKRELLIYAVVVALSIGLAFLVILYFIKKRNKKKLLENEQQKNTAKLQLNSIRSQLNPHFMFNALSGIQNLMNKNDIDNANQYLAKFARLTRNVLDDKELISLSQEKKLLDDYLQMEQLRFGFKYEIKHAEGPDLDITEIPAMLLQPFVENAVKHGISKRAADGKITITFARQKNDLVLTVNDNGNGFDTGKKNNGLGLQLSNSRIALLNDIYKENRFTLAIQSSQKGTEISLTLTDWL
ncbi:Sensor histidine kinase YpdA [compost metagenome]